VLRGGPTMMYYMARHGLAGRMGWGPKYTVVLLQHQAHKGLDQVGARQRLGSYALCILVTRMAPVLLRSSQWFAVRPS
jgi:hypothetical protein